jgi:hypothetical protein
VIALNASTDHKKVAFSIEPLGINSSIPTTVFGPDMRPRFENNILHIEVPPRTGTVIRLS